MKLKNIIGTVLCFAYLFCLSSCKKWVAINGPATSVSSKDVYNTKTTAIGVLTDLYVSLSSASIVDGGEFSSLSVIAGLSADELTLYEQGNSLALSAYYKNSLSSTTSDIWWATTYNRIFVTNAAIEGLTVSNLEIEIKRQLLGEAKFMRAFYYLYLSNLYGEVPLILSTDYSVNALVPKSSKQNIYEQIVKDLKEAQNLLSDHYVKADLVTAYPIGVEERVRPTKWAAIALLARVSLYQKEWVTAEKEATTVLNNTQKYGLESLDHVFSKNSKEAIWQLPSVNKGVNTADALVFILPTSGPSEFSNPVYLSEKLVSSFEKMDQRNVVWIQKVIVDGVTYFYPFKYKTPYQPNALITEHKTVMRLAEQFLIRAEARAEQSNLEEAIADLDVIRARAGLDLIRDVNPGINQKDLLKEIYKQRQLELFTEWGHRWLDLKRIGLIDEVMATVTPTKGNAFGWKSYQQYYPIPLEELKKNPRLTPTPGY